MSASSGRSKQATVGFGAYRVGGTDREEHRLALRRALELGIPLIDTSSNYMDGDSERLIGETLKDWDRPAPELITKIGYLQGTAQERERFARINGRGHTEVTEVSPDCWHSFSPDFLKDELTLSLERLGVSKVDTLLLHNPEYFLKSGGSADEYYTRIRRAFEALEGEVADGRISRYGVSSNTFCTPSDDDSFTSLEVLLELAEHIDNNHHFKVVQFPFNVFEPGAMLESNQMGSRTVLELAETYELTTLANRPLNAYFENRLIRLAHAMEQASVKDLEQSLSHALTIETRYAKEHPDGARLYPAHWIREHLHEIPSLESWRNLLAYRLAPLLPRLRHETDAGSLSTKYADSLDRLFRVVSGFLGSAQNALADKILTSMQTKVPALTQTKLLQEASLSVLAAAPGLSHILLGMRRVPYVEQVLSESRIELTAEEAVDAMEAAFESLHQTRAGV